MFRRDAAFLCSAVEAGLTEFLIVRHGETLWNREHRIQGQRNSALSPSGERQALLTGQRLKTEGCVRLVSSDLGRALQTAQPIAAAAGLAIATDVRLRERAFGSFEGSTADEIRARDRAAHARWQAREADYAMPGGESLGDLQSRARACLESMAQDAATCAGKLIIVTHGGVLDVLYRIAAQLALDAPRTWPLLNSSINRIAIEDGAWRVVDWGDVTHLPAAEDDFG